MSATQHLDASFIELMLSLILPAAAAAGLNPILTLLDPRAELARIDEERAEQERLEAYTKQLRQVRTQAEAEAAAQQNLHADGACRQPVTDASKEALEEDGVSDEGEISDEPAWLDEEAREEDLVAVDESLAVDDDDREEASVRGEDTVDQDAGEDLATGRRPAAEQPAAVDIATSRHSVGAPAKRKREDTEDGADEVDGKQEARHRCDVCGFKTEYTSTYTRHRSSKHGMNEYVWSCPNQESCKANPFVRVDSFKRHLSGKTLQACMQSALAAGNCHDFALLDLDRFKRPVPANHQAEGSSRMSPSPSPSPSSPSSSLPAPKRAKREMSE